MKDFLKFLGVLIVGALIIMAFSYAFGWFGLGAQRQMQPFAAETSRLTESNSRNRIDGVNAGIVSLCLNMRSTADQNTKRAFASMLITDADSFQRQELLTPASQSCVSEARGILDGL